MWSNINQVIKPESINEALILRREPGTTFFSGGSYLVAQQEKHINTLLDINHLLTNEIKHLNKGLHLGSNCTLQELMGTNGASFDKAILSSCPSKNIRNQRALGGEIAKGRPNSELMAYLYAAEGQLQINGTEAMVTIIDWDGTGIITKVIIPHSNITLERVSVLDSAPAFVIVAVNQVSELIHICVGGKAEKLLYFKTTDSPDEGEIRNFMAEVLTIYPFDHFGTPEFKQQVVSNLLSKITGSS